MASLSKMDWRTALEVGLNLDSLWFFDRKTNDALYGRLDLDYQGCYIPQVADQVIRRFSNEGELVGEFFTGVGTGGAVAVSQGRNYVGIELNPGVAARARVNLEIATETKHGKDSRWKIITGNALEGEIQYMFYEAAQDCNGAHGSLDYGTGFCDLLILHPPYHNIVKFGDSAADLSNQGTMEEFIDKMRGAFVYAYARLRPGRMLALIIGDIYKFGRYIPLGFTVMMTANRVGFLNKGIIVKNMEGNEKGKGQRLNLWRYRMWGGNSVIFKHEYVVLLQKPEDGKAPGQIRYWEW